MPLAWLTGPEAFRSPAWEAAVEADPEATLFHSPRFLKLYWEEFAPHELRVAEISDGGRETIAATAVQDGTLVWLGGFEVTDYMGPVGVPEARDAAAKELLEALRARDDWRDADLGGLPEDGSWLPALRSAAEAVGLEVSVDDHDVAPFLPLPDSYDAYLAWLPSKLRHEIRRKERRLRHAYPDARLVDADAASLDDTLDRFFALHRSSVGEKGRFMLPGMELFFRRLGSELIGDGTLRLSELVVHGRPIAVALGFRWRDRFLLYNSAYDHGERHVAPGMVLVGELIRSAIEEGRRAFDMLKGDLSYKYRFGARPRAVKRLRLRRRA